MNVFETIEAVRRSVRQARAAGKSIGFIPTMGALHAGHLSLLDAARGECGYVVVSLFVNPTQFGPAEDLGSYPRTPEADRAACESHGADAIFAPPVEEMYPRPSLTQVAVPPLARGLCGRSRPEHFPGVCTVVAKLLNIVGPDRAYFGAKDRQQAVIVRRMAEDLNFPVAVVVCPTVREADGLAMSSRNRYLTGAQRVEAAALYGALQRAEGLIRREHPPAETVIEAIREHLAAHAPTGVVDYVEIVDPRELSDVQRTDRPVLIALAVGFGRARLIDNILVD